MKKKAGEQETLSTKQRLVDATYQLMLEEGAENVSIREIGRRVGCTSAALYKHFESLDYLIMISSMRFLEKYLGELAAIERGGGDSVRQDLDAWFAFNHYAFGNPPVFLSLFWGPSSSSFEDAVVEYYQLFPIPRGRQDEMFYGYLYSAAFRGNIQERDLVLLRHGASEGTITFDDAVYLSKVDCYIVQSMLREHLSDYKEPGMARKAAEECNALLEKTVNAFRIRN